MLIEALKEMKNKVFKSDNEEGENKIASFISTKYSIKRELIHSFYGIMVNWKKDYNLKKLSFAKRRLWSIYEFQLMNLYVKEMEDEKPKHQLFVELSSLLERTTESVSYYYYEQNRNANQVKQPVKENAPNNDLFKTLGTMISNLQKVNSLEMNQFLMGFCELIELATKNTTYVSELETKLKEKDDEIESLKIKMNELREEIEQFDRLDFVEKFSLFGEYNGKLKNVIESAS